MRISWAAQVSLKFNDFVQSSPAYLAILWNFGIEKVPNVLGYEVWNIWLSYLKTLTSPNNRIEYHSWVKQYGVVQSSPKKEKNSGLNWNRHRDATWFIIWAVGSIIAMEKFWIELKNGLNCKIAHQFLMIDQIMKISDCKAEICVKSFWYT